MKLSLKFSGILLWCSRIMWWLFKNFIRDMTHFCGCLLIAKIGLLLSLSQLSEIPQCRKTWSSLLFRVVDGMGKDFTIRHQPQGNNLPNWITINFLSVHYLIPHFSCSRWISRTCCFLGCGERWSSQSCQHSAHHGNICCLDNRR